MEKKSCGCAVRTKEKFNAGLTKDAKAIVAGVEGWKRRKSKESSRSESSVPAYEGGGRCGEGCGGHESKGRYENCSEGLG